LLEPLLQLAIDHSDALRQLFLLPPQARLDQRSIHRLHDLTDPEGLDKVVPDSESERLHGYSLRAMSGDENGGNLPAFLLDGLKDFKAIHLGHLQIEQDQIRITCQCQT